MFEFRKLEVHKKSKTFYAASLKLIDEKKFHRTVNDQLTRASFSIGLNITDGSGRYSKRDRRNFFVISRSSVFECVAILDMMQDDQRITEQEFDNMHDLADELSRMLYAMRKNLEP